VGEWVSLVTPLTNRLRCQANRSLDPGSSVRDCRRPDKRFPLTIKSYRVLDPYRPLTYKHEPNAGQSGFQITSCCIVSVANERRQCSGYHICLARWRCENLALSIGDCVSLLNQRTTLTSAPSQFVACMHYWGRHAPWQRPPSVVA